VALHCLSCEQPLKTNETCENTCEIQTYLVLETDTAGLYIKRSLNRLDVKRDTSEIPIRRFPDTAIASSATDTPHTAAGRATSHWGGAAVGENQPHARDTRIPEHPNAHTDVAGQILTCLKQAPENTATTQQLLAACNCSREGLNKALKKLIAAGRIQKIKRGAYELINHKTTDNDVRHLSDDTASRLQKHTQLAPGGES